MLSVYLCVSTLAFSFLALVWSSRTWPDLAIKFALSSLPGSGVVLFLMSIGLVIKS